MLKDVSSRINNCSNTNVLEDVFETLRFKGNIFFNSELASPWGISMNSINSPRFHIALKGDFHIGVGDRGVGDLDDRVVIAKPMDIVVIPHGDMHWIADQTDRELTPAELAGEACSLGSPLFQQGKITNKLICGIVNYDQNIYYPLLKSLPQVIHFSKFDSSDPIWMTVQIIEAEMKVVHPNKNSMIDRLTEVLFLQLLNKYVSEHREESGFFAALRNNRVHQVLELFHREPEFPWTLEVLGKKVGMSRATLVRQFKDTVGVPPMTYISNWRMLKAYHFLKYSSISLDEIADLVGFSSARTFSKAFQRHYNYTPSELRRES